MVFLLDLEGFVISDVSQLPKKQPLLDSSMFEVIQRYGAEIEATVKM